jgi:hypothetical protein
MSKRLKLALLILVIALSFIVSIWYLGLLGLFTAIPSSLLIIVLTNLEWVAGLIASSYKIGRNVNFWFEKKAVEKRIENTIDSASKKVNNEGVIVLPHSVDIKWVEPMKRDAFLEEGKVVVCLESSYNEARNLARATMLYVADDLIRESQRFINPLVTKSICFAIGRKLLMLDKRLDALKCLNEEFIEPEAKKERKIREYVVAMEKMDEQGYLTRILLREFAQLDIKLSPALSNSDALGETDSFTRYLGTFVLREREEHVQLDYNRKVFRTDLMPIARSITEFDVSTYTRAASICFNNGIGTIYVLAWEFNIVWAKSAVKAIEGMGKYAKVDEFTFPTLSTQGKMQSYLAVLMYTGGQENIPPVSS